MIATANCEADKIHGEQINTVVPIENRRNKVHALPGIGRINDLMRQVSVDDAVWQARVRLLKIGHGSVVDRDSPCSDVVKDVTVQSSGIGRLVLEDSCIVMRLLLLLLQRRLRLCRQRRRWWPCSRTGLQWLCTLQLVENGSV